MTLSSLLRITPRLTPAAARRTSRAASSVSGTRAQNSLDSILIANRGEIALYVFFFFRIVIEHCGGNSADPSRRVSRTAAEHGIRVTTLYTDPDSRSQHALSSPFAYNLGSVSAYLDGDRIIEIAKKEGCRGIHPGYGFVSCFL